MRVLLQTLIPQRVTVSYLGESNPVADNATVSGRSRNRRVDLRFATDRSAPQPPGPQPPGPQPPGGGKDDDQHICDTYPLLCGIGITPFLLPLICLIAPEACAAVGCALAPELCVPQPPGPPQPPEPPEPPEHGGPHVTFVPAVRADNTPSGAPDRIGLRDPVYVSAVVVTPMPLTTPITVDVDGVSPLAGNATVNGAAQVQIMGTTMLEIRGVTMTAPNFAFSPALQLGAWWSGDLVGASNRFGVSSIMQGWTVALDGVKTFPMGHVFYARMDWVSDSGAYHHLNECRYVELVMVASEDGGMDVVVEDDRTPHRHADVRGDRRRRDVADTPGGPGTACWRSCTASATCAPTAAGSPPAIPVSRSSEMCGATLTTRCAGN